MKSREVVDYQTVKNDIYEEFACILLRDKELSKQEALLAGLMRVCDRDGTLRLGVVQREDYCRVFGMSMAEFNNALVRYRKAGLLISSGDYLTFANGMDIKTPKLYIFIK